MIIISGNPVQPEQLAADYAADTMEWKILSQLAASSEKYNYDSKDQLKFEIRMRKAIIDSAYELNKSDMDFAIFRKSECNPEFWNRESDGGFVLKDGVKPSEAVRDIFVNSSKYATECATAMMIVYYKALLDIYPEALFNKTFPSIELMNWHHIDKLLKEAGQMKKQQDFIPGDRRYFVNPDVNPLTPQWQGENVIDLDGKKYYGHGVGILDEEKIIKALNKNRSEGADESAYLNDTAGRPNFKRLADIYLNDNG
jgi:protein-glutamine gamma-glutamyltransferase